VAKPAPTPRALDCPILLVSAVGNAHGWVPHGLGLLKGYLTKTTAYPVETLSLCVRFSEYVRRAHPALVAYDRQMGEWGSSFHELYFAARYFAHADPGALLRAAADDYVHGGDIYRATPWDPPRERSPVLVEFHTERLLELCRRIDEFSHRELAACLGRAPFLIGFSVMAQQLYSSAMLARAARAACPGAVIVFGGAAITSASAGRILALVGEVDAVVVGDGEEVIRQLAEAVAAGRAIPRIPGVVMRGLPAMTAPAAAPAAPPPLDDIPPPDWDELRELIASPGRPLTTWMGRGCSWGRCSFCSIPEFQRKLFHRSPRRVVEDLLHLHRRYGTRRFRLGDWEVNGSVEVLAELCQLLADTGERFELWAEVNARNLSEPLVAAMKRAGFVSLQVGLEAFSTALLRKMRKPATVLDNVQALQYAHAHQVELFSNLLFNFPGEAPDDVDETLAVIRRIRHLLRPPVTVSLLEFLLETDADIHGQLVEAAAHVGAPYRFEAACLPAALADGGPYYLRSWTHPVDARWRAVYTELERCRSGAASFTHHAAGDDLVLVDHRDDPGGARGDGPSASARLTGVEAAIYRALIGRKITRARLAAELPDVPAPALDRCLDAFEHAGWALHDKQAWLALSVPAPEPGAVAGAAPAVSG
jgi:hypothetical protein